MQRVLVSASVLIFAVFVQKASALQCWKCSSDIDPLCNDHFNASEILSRRGGGLYDNLQNYNNRQNYDPNYNPNYNNQNFNNYNSQNPTLDRCDDNEANLRRMKNVCIKKTIKGTNYVSIVRRCAMIAPSDTVGTCHDPVSRGLNLEFCEYCDYDGCNSATGLKTNVALASLFAVAVLLFRH